MSNIDYSRINPENLEKRENTDLDVSVENIGKSRIESLKKSISDIKTLIEQREKISKDIVNEADGLKTEINNFFNNLLDDTGDPREKIALKNKKTEISELQLNEKINCWRDIASLKKELRDLESELSEREERNKMIGGSLE